jgi:Protein of unknown function (DUF1559)
MTIWGAREQDACNLKMIGLAMHEFAAANIENRLPPVAIRNEDKPLLSWRVAILPFLDHQTLYEEFRLDEPWNSPHNRSLLNQMPDVYAPVVPRDEPLGSTYYQVFVGAGALFDDELGPKMADIKNGVSNAISVVEAASPVPWTKPEDIVFDRKKPVPKLGRQFRDGFHVEFVDGAVFFLRSKDNREFLRPLITCKDGQVIRREYLLQAALAPQTL